MTTRISQDSPTADELVGRLEPLYSAVIADVLDGLGFRRQTLDNQVRPLTPMRRVSGRIFTAHAHKVTEIPVEAYKLEIAAVDSMKRGDVLVIDAEYDQACGFWGELLTTACLYKGVRGVVMTACTRDMWKIKELGFPVFGIGFHPADSKGRADIVAIGEPIIVAGVAATTGDYLLGDEDGVVIIPQEVAGEAIRLAEEKVSGENIVRAELARGVPMGEVFKKHGIL